MSASFWRRTACWSWLMSRGMSLMEPSTVVRPSARGKRKLPPDNPPRVCRLRRVPASTSLLPSPSTATLDWGRTRYADAWKRQDELVARRIAGEVGDTLVFTEHE